MKKVISILFVLAFVGTVSAQSSTMISDSFKVYGNCDQCKHRIEKAAKGTKGVSVASWDEKTEILQVTYDSSKVNEMEIHSNIAKVGHDTDKMRAKNFKYKSLPDCCLYKRAPMSDADEPIQTIKYHITGMTCAEGCAKGIEGALYKLKGVKSSKVDFNSQIATVVYDRTKIETKAFVYAIENYDSGEKGKGQYHAEEIK